MELVVLVCVRQCRAARPQDTVVLEAPFVMRRLLAGAAAVDLSGTDHGEAIAEAVDEPASSWQCLTANVISPTPSSRTGG